MAIDITGIKTTEYEAQGINSTKKVNNREIALASEKQTQQGDIVSLSDEAKKLSKATSEQKGSISSNTSTKDTDNGNVSTGNISYTESEDEGGNSESKVESLQKMLENAKEELEKAQKKFSEAQAKLQSSDSEEEKEMAQVEVAASQTEVSMAQANIIEIQSQLSEAQTEELKG